MNLSQPGPDWPTSWPQAIVLVAVLLVVLVLVGGAMAAWLDLRKAKMTAAQEDSLRRLVQRYEQLAESSLDAQQRMAADLSELRTRATSIEQILSTVE